MALYDGDMINVSTPDGRTLTVPSSFAAQFPGLQQTPPPPEQALAPSPIGPPAMASPQEIAAPDLSDAGREAGAGPGAMAPQPGIPMLPPPNAATAGPITSPTQAPDAGAPNVPATPPPMTSAGLAKLGNAGVYNAESDALDQRGAAISRAALVDANEATKVGNAMAARDAESQRILEQRNAAAQANQQAMDAKMLEYETNAKKIADVKIDRGLDHPILAAIGLALGSIGSAMNHQQGNPALDMLLKQVDRKVAAQMQDVGLQRDSLAQQRADLTMSRDLGKDRLAEYDQRRVAAIDQAARQIETIKAQSGSDRTKANADIALAGLNEERAKTLGAAMQREQDRLTKEEQRKDTLLMHKQSIGVQYAAQAQAERHWKADSEEHKFEFDTGQKNLMKEKADALAEKYAALGQKDKADKAKKVGEAGIWDPSTGDVMLDPEGRKKIAQADSYEAQARTSKDPAQTQKLNEAAAALHESAQLNNAVVAPDKEAAAKLRPMVVAAQSITDELGTAEQLLSGDPSVIDRQEWAGLKTKLGDIAVKYAQAAGEKVSPRAIDSALEHIINFDPDSTYSRATGKGKALASIKELRTIVSQSMDAELKGNGIKSGWSPSSPLTSLAPKFSGHTADEIGEDAKPGLLSRAVGPLAHLAGNVLHPIDTINGDRPATYDPERIQRDAEEAARARVGMPGEVSKASIGKSSNYGLDPRDDDQLRGLIERDASVGHAEHLRIVKAIAGPIEEGKRPSLSIGMLNLLRDQNPALYREVLGQLPPEQAKDLARATAPIAIPDLQPTGNLGPEARAAYEQYRRAKGIQ